MMEFHISRKARDRYRFPETLFSLTGNVVFANLSASREFAHRMNQVRDADRHPERAVNPGALYTMGLIDEATHAVLASYREQFDPALMTDALGWFSAQVGAENLDKLLLRFVEHFPGINVYRDEETPAEWLNGSSDGAPNRAAALEEMMLLWMANHNEAFRPFGELFEDGDVAEKTAYSQVTSALPDYFATRPMVEIDAAHLEEDPGLLAAISSASGSSALGSPVSGSKLRGDDPGGARGPRSTAPGKPPTIPVTIFELLRAPALTSPGSLSGQVARIQRMWKPLLGDSLKRGLSIASGVLREEEVAIWTRFHPPSTGDRVHDGRDPGWADWSAGFAGAGGDGLHEYEKFSPDVAWMPTAVLLAKSTYVWLAQLTTQYGRPITRLDQIPDEELALLARRGMNSLWLIGVWERSRASQQIKQLCGNADAVASAYSLFDYHIAEDLGGPVAYENLRDRAYRKGIRLASDMVANHMGIDSPWVVEHPEWFLSRQDKPYPAYNFDGPDLSSDSRVEIKIEKHYYQQTDAAVVFQRVDRQSGETRYIYHGNDGTSFPWNDTAQLDYLNPAVREQVIQTILRVARMFPVIRFDAAMTLAKRHFHRLWFPGPDATGAIPSRAEYGMSDEEFNQLMPHEFWREVVDRVAADVPGTLLLAEAFWLMESYFVRTLGMHRVYNSAFMVMLRDEDNANYRGILKNTLKFDPDILKRYVNFMSNPDERTAIDQFGDGDKCFGVAALMATLPGLPMFGHGQVEGYTEKYGMEYRRPRMDETPNQWLVDRHQRQIAPLLHERSLFAESSNFRLYDFVRDDGGVEEDVYAHSNHNGDRRGVVVYNNRYGTAHGRIDMSAVYADKGSGEERQQRLWDSLGFNAGYDIFLGYRDSLTGLEYLRRASDVAQGGLRMQLNGYQCHVLLDWRELRATAEQRWDRLHDQLNGHGVQSLTNALVNLELEPTHEALRALLNPVLLHTMAKLATTAATGSPSKAAPSTDEFLDSASQLAEHFFEAARAAYAVLGGSVAQKAQKGPKAGLAGVPDGAEATLNRETLVNLSTESDFQERLKAAIRLPSLEALFPGPWPVEARKALPSLHAEESNTAIWGTVVAWCVLQSVAASVPASNQDLAALDVYDKLRLREPLGHAFARLGFEEVEAWRAAARTRVLLLAQGEAAPPADETLSDEAPSDEIPSGEVEDAQDEAGPEVEAPQATEAVNGVAADAAEEETMPLAGDASSEPEILSPALWQDADVRWLTGLHEAGGAQYFAKEAYEELVWWLQLPALLEMAAGATPDPGRAAEVGAAVDEALLAAAEAGYRADPTPAPAPVLPTDVSPTEVSPTEVELALAHESSAYSASEAVALDKPAE